MKPCCVPCERSRILQYANSESIKSSKRRWNARNPEKRAAHKTVELAVASGRLKKRPCKVCGDARSQAHHPDYSKPLKVVWFCQKHHKAEHKKRPLARAAQV